MWVINHQNFLCTKRICFIHPHNLWLHLNNSGNLQRAWRRWCQVCHQLRLPQQQWGLHSQVWRSYDQSKFRLWKANTRQTSFGMGWLKNFGFWIGCSVLWSRNISSEQKANNKDLKWKTNKKLFQDWSNWSEGQLRNCVHSLHAIKRCEGDFYHDDNPLFYHASITINDITIN